MDIKKGNPFAVTKAENFSDHEILDYWVDFNGSEDGTSDNFERIVAPTEKMSRVILGGKGSGKTHILRYFSYNVQKIRQPEKTLIEKIKEDGYLGLYVPCSGLHSDRFQNSHKNIAEEQWKSLFYYYFELGLSQMFLQTIAEILEISDAKNRRITIEKEKIFVAEIAQIFNGGIENNVETLGAVRNLIIDERKKIDVLVNNSAFTGNITHKILVTHGELVHGLSSIFMDIFSNEDSSFQFVYIIDELENLEEYQQAFINTLYRHKSISCTYRIGARLDGIKTWKTLSAGEENKEGSEFDLRILDDILRNTPNYKDFAKKLVLRRLEKYGYNFNEETLKFLYGDSLLSELSNEDIDKIKDKYKTERPWIKKLRSKLQYEKIHTEDNMESIITLLTDDKDFYQEKYNCFALYKHWVKDENLLQAAKRIQKEKPDPHWKSDMVAQIRRESEIKQKYCGIDTFIEMSSGLPRSLLVILKNIFDWFVWSSSKSQLLDSVTVSASIQKDAVLQSAQWFINDAISPTKLGNQVKASINRLGDMFRTLRYSDKPSECSLATFYISGGEVNENTSEALKLAKANSLLLEYPRRSKDSNSREMMYQINPMIAPLWDLSIGRRGTLSISAKNVDMIFGVPENTQDAFESYCKELEAKRQAPYFGKQQRKQTDNNVLFKEVSND